MKLRSAPLDEVYNEVDFVLRSDSRFLAGMGLWLCRKMYSLCRGFLLATLRLSWRDDPAPAGFPAIGHEPFNVSPSEIKENW